MQYGMKLCPWIDSVAGFPLYRPYSLAIPVLFRVFRGPCTEDFFVQSPGVLTGGLSRKHCPLASQGPWPREDSGLLPSFSPST